MTIDSLIAVITGISGLIGSGVFATFVYRRQNRRIKNAEATNAELSARQAAVDIDRAVIEQYEHRIEQLHETVTANNNTITEMSRTISMLNHTIDNKTARIREIEDRLIVTERENTRLAEENGELRADLASHRCVIKKCGGRDPANEHTCAALENGTAIWPRPEVSTTKQPIPNE